MNDSSFLAKIAELWIDLGGDSEGVLWTNKQLYEAVKKLEKEGED